MKKSVAILALVAFGLAIFTSCTTSKSACGAYSHVETQQQ